MVRTSLWTIVVVLTFVVSACSGTTVRPDDMSAEAHEAAAAKHADMAERAEDREDEQQGLGGISGVSDPLYPESTYDPAAAQRAEKLAHRKHASDHLAAAQALRDFEAAECGQFPPTTRAVCPLLGSLASVDDVPGGVRITLVDGVNREALVAHIKCHFAFGQKEGFAGMDMCPLYVKGLKVADTPEGIVLTTDDPKYVDRVRTQTREHLAGMDAPMPE